GPSGRRRSASGARPGGGWVRRRRDDGETEVPGHIRGDGRDWGMAIYVPLTTADLAPAAPAPAQVSLLAPAEPTRRAAGPPRGGRRGLHSLAPPQEERLHLAFEDFGVELLPADDDAGIGHGVRRKFNPRTVKRLENWENEGGPAAEDDI